MKALDITSPILVGTGNLKCNLMHRKLNVILENSSDKGFSSDIESAHLKPSRAISLPGEFSPTHPLVQKNIEIRCAHSPAIYTNFLRLFLRNRHIEIYCQ